jgi:single-strand DNA-binding protein
MNTITVAGNVGQQPEMRSLQNGDSVLSFSVADSQKSKAGETTTWFRCVIFGKRAEALVQHINKGDRVTIVGTLAVREYEGKHGKATSLDVRVSEIALQGRSGAEASRYGTSGHGANAKHTSPDPMDRGGPLGDDDVPFIRIETSWDKA